MTPRWQRGPNKPVAPGNADQSNVEGVFQAAKEGWLKAVASHPNLSGADCAVAIVIATYLNSKTRDAWPGFDRLAQETNRNRSTVWRSIARLEKFKLLEVRRARGRSRSNHYRPLLGDLDRDPITLRRRNKHTASSQSKDCEFAARTSDEV
jgi:hypothetical protein